MDRGRLFEPRQTYHLHGLSLEPSFQTVWNGAQRSCRWQVLAHYSRSDRRYRWMRCLIPKWRLNLNPSAIDGERQPVALLRFQGRLKVQGEPAASRSYW